MADGDLKFDTKIDTDGFNKGVNSLKKNFNSLDSTVRKTGSAVDNAFSGKASSRVVDLTGKIEQTENQVKSLKAEMEKIANTPFVSKDATKLNDQVKSAEQQLFSLLNQKEALEDSLLSDIQSLGLPVHEDSMHGVYEANREWIKLTDQIDKAEIKLSDYESKLKEVQQADKSVIMTETEGYKRKEQKLSELTNKLDVYRVRLNEVRQAEERKAESAEKVSKTTDKVTKSMSKANKTAIPLTKSILKLSNMFKLMLMRMAIRAAMDAIKEGFQNLAQVSPEVNRNLSLLKSSLTQLKNSLATAFAPILNIVTPILNGFIQLVSRAADSVAHFFAILGGKSSYKRAIQVQENYAESLKKTGSQAKKTAKDIRKSITGIDDVTILNSNKNDTGSGAGSGAGGITPDQMFDEVAVNSKFKSVIDNFKEKIKELADVIEASFTEGFKKGLGKVNFDEIKEHARGIKRSLLDIFTDKDVKRAAYIWVKDVSYALGELSGSAASVGLTLAEMLVGSVDNYLSQNSKFIKEKLVSIFSLRGETARIASDFATSAAEIFTIFRSEAAKQMGSDLIAIFANSFLEIVELSSKFGRDLLKALTKHITDNVDDIKVGFQQILETLKEWVGGIKDFFAVIFESLQSTYDNYISPALERFSDGFGRVFESVLNAYNTYFAPVIQGITERFREVINGPFKDMIQSFTDLVGKIIDGIMQIWSDTIAPFIAWMINTFGPSFSKVIGVVGNVIADFLSVVFNVVSGLLKALGGVIDFIAGVFTGDWKKAWNGIKTFLGGIISAIMSIVAPIASFFRDRFNQAWGFVKSAFSNTKSFFTGVLNGIKGVFNSIPSWFKTTFTNAWNNVKNVFSSGGKIFTGIKDGIANVFKSVVNGLIGGINRVISIPFNNINRMLNSIRSISILGISPFSRMWGYNPLKVPQIPRLATGTVVPANFGEFMAILGDNKREAEVVSPLSTMKQALKEALRESGGGGGGTTILKVYLEGKQVYDEVVRQNNYNTRRTGENALA